MKRRDFFNTAGVVMAGSMLSNPLSAEVGSRLPSHSLSNTKKKVALVGTGSRGTGFWGKPVIRKYGDRLEFVALCDVNPGRLELAKKIIGIDCPVFTDFDEMLLKTKPDLVIVTTGDATHHFFIIKALDFGCDVITEKPMTKI